MSVAAVVYLPEAQSRQWALRPAAGRSVLLRLLLTAARAGVREIGLPRILADESLLSWTRRRPDRAPRVFSLQDRAFGSEPLLLLPANSVVDAGSLMKIREAAESGILAALEESKGPAPILVMTGEQIQSLRDQFLAGTTVGEELEGHLRSGQLTLIPGGGYFVSVSDEGSRRQAEAVLYQSLGTEADSLIDRRIHRPCSRLLTRLLVRLPVTPNIASLVSLALGLTAAWQFWSATPGSALLGFLFYMLGVVIDHADGDLARLTFQESPFGRWLDVSVDTMTHALLALGMATTASSIGGELMFLAGGVAAFGIIMSAIFANFLLPRTDQPRRLARVLLRLGNRDPFYVVLICFIVFLWKVQWALPHLIEVLALGSQTYWLSCLVQRKLAGR